MVEPTPIRPASLHEEVATRIRGMVFERQLAPGQWIDEMALAREWQISRTPLREALKVLAAEGLVTAVPRLERLDPLGDLSAKGVKQSLGLMVNYLYDLQKIESHHEMFIQGEVAHSRALASLL